LFADIELPETIGYRFLYWEVFTPQNMHFGLPIRETVLVNAKWERITYHWVELVFNRTSDNAAVFDYLFVRISSNRHRVIEWMTRALDDFHTTRIVRVPTDMFNSAQMVFRVYEYLSGLLWHHHYGQHLFLTHRFRIQRFDNETPFAAFTMVARPCTLGLSSPNTSTNGDGSNGSDNQDNEEVYVSFWTVVIAFVGFVLVVALLVRLLSPSGGRYHRRRY